MSENSRDTWRILEESIVPEKMADNEALFSLANGYLGIRGCFEEPACSWCRGTYLNGFYESHPITYGEKAYGYPEQSQTILNVADGRKINVWIDGEAFDILQGRVRKYHRELDLREGILVREIEWESPGKRIVKIRSERIVPMSRTHTALIRYEVTPVSSEMNLRIQSTLDGNVKNMRVNDDPRVGASLGPETLLYKRGVLSEERAELLARTRQSQLTLACGVRHQLQGAADVQVQCFSGSREVGVEISCKQGKGNTFRFDKFLSYSYRSISEEAQNLDHMREALDAACRDGFDQLKKEQFEYLNNFWEHSDVCIEGDVKMQQGLRFNLFHLLQAAGRHGRTSMPAKGLSGEGYEGHYFWDTEIYVLPLFIYTQPDIAQSLLEYRYSILDQARERAGDLSQKGALFPWRTINGRESSAYYPAGTAQYHIDADIVYGIKKFLQITGRFDFLPRAAEIAIETARMWHDLGEFIPRQGGAYCINGVTGPDEYTAIVNNNYYTNIMARENLVFSAEILENLRERDPAGYDELILRTKLKKDEPEQWKKAAGSMYLPYDQELGIHPQDDSFLNKKVWPLADTPFEKRPLLLHYHPLVIYRHQILKQADLVLALFLLGDQFSLAQKRRDFDYYDKLTTGDSSLSPCVQSVIAAEVGLEDLAYEYFRRTARIDLDNVNGNVRDGLHTAAMAGTWTSIVYGFAGMRDYNGKVSFQPHLPQQWKRLTFNLNIRRNLLEVAISHDEVAYTLKEGTSLDLYHEGYKHTVYQGSPLVFSIRPELKAVIFDLDGVITDSAEYHFQAWEQLCGELNIPFDREFNHNLRGVGRMQSLEFLLDLVPERSYTEAEKVEFANRKNEYYKKLIARITPEDLLPGIADLLEELKDAGIMMALASASRNAPSIMQQLRIEDYFEVITDPGEVGKGKPDPEQFYLAAEMLRVPIRNCVGVEDAQAGVDAINSAGMFSIGVGEYLVQTDWKCDSTGELNLEKMREVFYGRT